MQKVFKACRWWQNAESPWQCLAVCKNIQEALDSGDPSTYVSHTPVMMDGSCNGLQHYAALGKDYAGGKSVNLTDMDEPQVPPSPPNTHMRYLCITLNL